jgi:hypothetical protein
MVTASPTLEHLSSFIILSHRQEHLEGLNQRAKHFAKNQNVTFAIFDLSTGFQRSRLFLSRMLAITVTDRFESESQQCQPRTRLSR